MIVALRVLWMTAAEIAEALSAIRTARDWQARTSRLEQPQRYERARPGELVHIDVKKLGRITRGANRESATGR